jgi:hypothetical protein
MVFAYDLSSNQVVSCALVIEAQQRVLSQAVGTSDMAWQDSWRNCNRQVTDE